MEWIENGVAATCGTLGKIHINCSTQLLEIRLGHVLFVAAFVALVLLVLRLTIWRKLEDRGYIRIKNITFSGAAVSGDNAVYFQPWDLAEAIDQQQLLDIPKTKAEQELRPNFEKKYFRVRIIEQNGVEVYRNELRILPRAWGQ